MFRWMSKRNHEVDPDQGAGDARTASPQEGEGSDRNEEWRKQQEATIIATTTSVTF